MLTTDAVSALGASFANVSTLDWATGTFTLVAAVSTPEVIVGGFSTFPLDAPLPSRDAVHTGGPVLLSSIAERDRRYPTLAVSRPGRRRSRSSRSAATRSRSGWSASAGGGRGTSPRTRSS